MKLSRRQFLRLATCAVALPSVSRVAVAQSYPARPVRIIVGFGPGGVTDLTARVMAQWLSERLGQQFVVENRPGAGTNIATQAVVRASPDGYTLLQVTGANAINATLYDKLNFNFIEDITPVACIYRTAGVMVVNPAVPAKTLPEFLAIARTSPGKINMAAVGVGSAQHIWGELFKMMASVDLVTVHYRDPVPAMTDLLGGQVQVSFDPLASSIEQIRAGKLRPLAVTAARRSELLPDVPTVGEFVAGYEASGWQGIGAPKGTPAEIVDRLDKEINAALADASMRARLADLGGTVLSGSPADFGKLIVDETAKWAKVIKVAGIKAE